MRRHRSLPVIGSIILALMLTMVPLPASIDTYRPDWVALVLIYWTMMLPQSYSVGIAWLVGLLLDVAQGTLLGQHALALVVIIFLTSRFHLLMRVFPMSQLTATVFALLTVYQFLLFWINGVAGVAAPAASYWAPVITGTFFWPIVAGFLSGLRFRNLARS
ncbi:MAG: rod shape-determining protein MreD [Woeseiaceae bacterium]|jgi:rod shape-determining protein MreD|nr:rod shape-determining protein MreD [Woeseiaceae bacterium]